MYSKMNDYLSMLSRKSDDDLIKILKHLSTGSGYQLGEIMIEFSNGSDPYLFIDFPELQDFDGVGFYCIFDPPPMLVEGSVFYEKLKLILHKRMEGKSNEFNHELKSYLDNIMELCIKKREKEE